MRAGYGSLPLHERNRGDLAKMKLRWIAPFAEKTILNRRRVDRLCEAAFVTHQPRPDFPGKENDWPKGGKPVDARY